MTILAVPETGQVGFSYTATRRSASAGIGAVFTQIHEGREQRDHLRTGGRVVKGNRL